MSRGYSVCKEFTHMEVRRVKKKSFGLVSLLWTIINITASLFYSFFILFYFFRFFLGVLQTMSCF